MTTRRAMTALLLLAALGHLECGASVESTPVCDACVTTIETTPVDAGTVDATLDQCVELGNCCARVADAGLDACASVLTNPGATQSQCSQELALLEEEALCTAAEAMPVVDAGGGGVGVVPDGGDGGEGGASTDDGGADGCTDSECVDDCNGDPECITSCGC